MVSSTNILGAHREQPFRKVADTEQPPRHVPRAGASDLLPNVALDVVLIVRRAVRVTRICPYYCCRHRRLCTTGLPTARHWVYVYVFVRSCVCACARAICSAGRSHARNAAVRARLAHGSSYSRLPSLRDCSGGGAAFSWLSVLIIIRHAPSVRSFYLPCGSKRAPSLTRDGKARSPSFFPREEKAPSFIINEGSSVEAIDRACRGRSF